MVAEPLSQQDALAGPKIPNFENQGPLASPSFFHQKLLGKPAVFSRLVKFENSQKRFYQQIFFVNLWCFFLDLAVPRVGFKVIKVVLKDSIFDLQESPLKLEQLLVSQGLFAEPCPEVTLCQGFFIAVLHLVLQLGQNPLFCD